MDSEGNHDLKLEVFFYNKFNFQQGPDPFSSL